MKKLLLLILISSVCGTGWAASSGRDQPEQYAGTGFNLEITTGLQGALSFAQVGVNFPQFINHFLLGVKFRGMSSLTWATFIDESTKESVSFHPVVLAGIVSFGGTGNIIGNLFRTFGTCEILGGYSFTPYDSAVYGVGNLIGTNITFGFFGTFGIEFFLSGRFSVYVESGGGFKTIYAPDKNQYVIAAAWIGSGVTFRMGTKIYFP